MHESLRSALVEAGATPIVINLAPPTLTSGIGRPFSRLPRIAGGLIKALAALVRAPGSTVYIGLSGGFGQMFDLVFVLLARLCGASLFIHHESYSYLTKPAVRTRLVLAAAGYQCTHIVLCEAMGDRLTTLYPRCGRVYVLSGVAFVDHDVLTPVPRARVRTLGFLSNISIEKGVLEYLEVVRLLAATDTQMRAILAGPFMNSSTETLVRERMDSTPSLRYLGPVHGMLKRQFFDTIDVLIFPTHEEAEGLVIHEAMAVGVPVIAWGRGCIASVITADSGLSIPISEDFVRIAVGRIRAWRESDEIFNEASIRARERFRELRGSGSEQLRRLVSELTTVAFAGGT